MSRGGSTSTNAGSSATADYYVCKVQDSAGSVTFEAIPSTEVKAREKALTDSYVTTAKSWLAANKDGGTTDPQPKKPSVVLGQKVRGRAMAENFAALLQEKWNKARGVTGSAVETAKQPSSADPSAVGAAPAPK